MTSEEIKYILELAATNLFKNQPNLFDLTDTSSQTEWNITHHYANEIHELIPDYDYDVDLNKPGVKNKRPDIVFHKRNTHESNFLVIEMKRKEKDMAGEVTKIKTLWFSKPLKYEYGAVVMISGLDVCQTIVLKNENR